MTLTSDWCLLAALLCLLTSHEQFLTDNFRFALRNLCVWCCRSGRAGRAGVHRCVLQANATANAAATARAERSAQGLPGCVDVLFPSKAGEKMVCAGALLRTGGSRKRACLSLSAAGQRRCWASA